MSKKKPSTADSHVNGDTARSPAYFLSLSLENVRCFGAKQTLDLSAGTGVPARWTVLLGNNGTGKTTVLQAVVAMAMDASCPKPTQWTRSEAEEVIAHFHRYERFITFLRTGSSKCTLRASFPTLLGESPVEREFHLFQADGRFGVQSLPPAAIQDRPPVPLFCGYGASRRLGRSAITEIEFGESTSTLFSEHIPLINAEQWLARLDYSSSKASPLQARGKLRLRQIIDLLISILPEVDDVRFVVEGEVVPSARVEVKTPFGWVPMRQLGYGYQTVIGWMVDLASRMVERYPDSPDPLAEPVIVLVDEIDLHLHPTWQRSLIARLDERFRKAQFIVTAHSPLVVQAAPDANLAVLRREGDQVVIDNDVDAIRNWRVDQILTSELFGLPTARPPQIERDLARRAELLQKPTLTAAEEKEVAEIETRIGYLPAGERREDVQMMQELHKALAVIGKGRPTKP